MTTIPVQILRLLEKKPLKPGELAVKLSISRQMLHKHLKVLLADKKIVRHGITPHVLYATATTNVLRTRVRSDYQLCQKIVRTEYRREVSGPLLQYLKQRGKTGEKNNIPDLAFLLDAAAVYSSNIEGNTLNLNSFLNSRMSPKKHRPKEAQEIEDLVSAYAFAKKNDLNEKNMLQAHKILSHEFVAVSRRGIYRKEPVGVFSENGLEYMAVDPHLVAGEMHTLCTIISELLAEKQTPAERFFWATWLHLMIARIHPFSDGNGRMARLCEKWFLATTLGEQSYGIPTEEHYWKNRSQYYAALKLGANYWEADMSTALSFFVLLPQAILRPSGK